MSPIGNQLDRYKILERLGEGGMSIVYRGLDTTLNREVAIKVMHSFLAPRADARHRFEREAQAVARLSHPNILEVYDYARGDGTDSFIVTELIRGKTLRELASERPFAPPELAALIIHEIALALAHAHRAGIIHRDLKPENVMVRNDGVLKLMDFGIAKIIEADSQMTATGTLLGSPAHMAPEVIEGKPVTPATDIFSLGTMLYFLATGTLPFNADSPAATFMKIIEGNYDDPRAINGAISDEFAQVIAKSMSTAPADRYQDADAFAAALSKITNHLGVDDAAKELRAYFTDRTGHEQKLISQIITRSLEQAQKAAKEKRTANSLSAINIVLTHDPNNEAAKELLASMQHRKRREVLQKKILRVGSIVALTAAVVAGGVYGIYRYQEYRHAAEVEAARVEEEQQKAAKLEAEKRDEAIRQTAQREAAEKYAKQAAVRPAPLAPAASVAPEHARPKAPGLVPVNVAIRPFGRLKIDNQPPTEDELALHRVRLTPGKHQFLVLCDRCDTNAKPEERIVVAGEDISLVAPLIHAKVSFVGFPENAKYIVNGAQVKKEHTITRPAGGQTSMRYTVNYEVKVGATPVERGQRFVLPGDSLTITKGASK